MSWLMTVEVSSTGNSSRTEAMGFYTSAMDALEKLDVVDPDLDGEIQQGPVRFNVTIKDEALQDAICHGITAVRTAIHEAGGSTPDWPHCDDLEPTPDGDGKWVVHFAGSSQRPALVDA